jgi:UDP-N-acetylmuramate dehydrogenase
LARFSARSGFENGEFFAGIPGTVGGALAMNAGAFGSETWVHVESVTCMNRKGECITRGKDEFEISYRKAVGQKEEWFVSAQFRFKQGDTQVAQDKIRALLTTRKNTQPTGEHTCGSVFKNPPGDHAGRLIESCGLKGFAIGGALVSPKHANFIVNQGEATAKEIVSLIQHIQHTVYTSAGIQLEPEVKIL